MYARVYLDECMTQIRRHSDKITHSVIHLRLDGSINRVESKELAMLPLNINELHIGLEQSEECS